MTDREWFILAVEDVRAHNLMAVFSEDVLAHYEAVRLECELEEDAGQDGSSLVLRTPDRWTNADANQQLGHPHFDPPPSPVWSPGVK